MKPEPASMRLSQDSSLSDRRISSGASLSAQRDYRRGGWLALAIVMIVMPLLFTQGFSLSLLQQAGIMIVFALSYNMMLGQAGMLSFGHALYFGLGAYFTMHTINAVGDGRFWFPLVLMPLIGGTAGAFFGLLLGYVSTRRAGLTFAMITLGLGELIHACAVMFSFFGGEGGISGNRVIGRLLFGITFGPGIEVYYLIAAWCFVCMLAMYAFTRTPLGLIANAVRDNAERSEYIGYNPRKVRWLVVIVSGFFAGIAGGLFAINYEIVTADSMSAWRSGSVLLATYIGGTAVFLGPAIGAIVFTLFSVALSDMTRAWPLYLGLFFIMVVLLSPGGVAGFIMAHAPVLGSRYRTRLALQYVAILVPVTLLLASIVLAVEMTYRISGEIASARAMTLWGLTVDAAAPVSWAAATGTLVASALVLRFLHRRACDTWALIQADLGAAGRAEAS